MEGGKKKGRSEGVADHTAGTQEEERRSATERCVRRGFTELDSPVSEASVDGRHALNSVA